MVPELRHHCGLFAVANHRDAVQLTYLGLYAQQHRGQESAGICATDGGELHRLAGMGLLTDAIDQRELEACRYPLAIGHVRYSTTGSSHSANIQPLLVSCSIGQVAICHNGNLVNAGELRREYETHGHIFVTTSDTEVILHMLADQRFASQPDPLAAVLQHLRGSYCLLLEYPDRIEAVRDPFGNRPLCLGRRGDAWIAASETVALDIIDAEYERDVEPGEIVTLTRAGITSRRFVPPREVRRAY
jgi:amidophosphoribosyltransferase